MHSSLAPNMEASLESKFSAAFEQQNSHTSSGGTSLGMKSGLLNGGGNHYHNAHHAPTGHHHHGHHKSRSHPVPATTTATPNTESSSGEKTVSFRKGNDLESFEALSSLYANGLFTDLVICCSGKMFKCHRVVMAAASLYIRDALSAFYNNAVDGNSGAAAGGCNNCNTVMILPKEIKMTDMEAILRFIYDGHVEVKVDAIESFLKSARMLNIKGLSNVNIVFNNNGSATDESVEDCSIEERLGGAAGSAAGRKQNNGYSKNAGVAGNSGSSNLHHHSSLLNGHAGVNSPPPSPPSMNNSLASLKALAAASTNQTSTPSAHVNGGKHLNGIGSAHHGVNFSNRSQFNRNHREHQLASLRANQSHDQHNNSLHQNHSSQNHSSSSILSHNLTPAHQSSTPKSIFANGNLFSGGNMRVDAASSIVPNASGSSSSGRRKQKFPTNIPPTAFNLNDAIPPLAAAALYLNPAAWLHNQSENDDDEDDVDESFEEKKLVIKDDSSNDCNSTGDNLSSASLDVSSNAANKAAAAGGHHNLGPFGQLPMSNFNPQMPCMIEVEADPTNFPTYCHDQSENMSQLNAQAAAAAATLLQTANKQRRRHFKSAFPSVDKFSADLFNSGSSKKLKLPFGGNALNSPNSDLSIKPFSPMMTAASHQGQQSSPVDLLTKIHGGGSAGALARHVDMEKGQPLFSAFSTVKTAAGANPSAGAAAGQSPSSVSSLPGSANWAGNKWKCDICNKYYGNKQTLKEHMDYFHSNREEQIYICNICNKEYTWRKSLMKHYRDIHQMRNTPALAEINRQLAALATTKGRSGMGGGPGSMASPMSVGSDHSGHGSALQSYVSISNSMNRHHQSSGGKASSVGDELSRDIDCDGDASVDAVPEEEDEEDDSNEEVEVEAGEEHSPNGSGHGVESPSDDHHSEAVNGSSEGFVKRSAPEEEDEHDDEHHPMIVDEGAAEKEDKTSAVAENSSNNSDHHSDASSAATVPENSSPVSSPPSFSS